MLFLLWEGTKEMLLVNRVKRLMIVIIRHTPRESRSQTVYRTHPAESYITRYADSCYPAIIIKYNIKYVMYKLLYIYKYVDIDRKKKEKTIWKKRELCMLQFSFWVFFSF